MTPEQLHAYLPDVIDTIQIIYREELGREPTGQELSDHVFWNLTQRGGRWEGNEIRASVHVTVTAPPPAPTPSRPSDLASLLRFPRRGASLYGWGDPGWDYAQFARMLADCGLNFTRWWGFGGWTDWQGRMPFKRRSDGRFDLAAVNEQYFDEAERDVAYFNSLGICVQWTILELYSWSSRKNVPRLDESPFRNNIQGVKWGGSQAEEDRTFTALPDVWLTEFIHRLVTRLRGYGVVYETGNEMPEKGLHLRIRDVIRAADPHAIVTTNRNSDSPGQYANMGVGRDFDAISFHGWRSLPWMDEVFHEEDATNRPKTYRELFSSGIDGRRVIASSDGARRDSTNYPFDLPALLNAFQFAWRRGASIEHMSGAKMVLFNEGKHDLGYVEMDFLRQVGKL